MQDNKRYGLIFGIIMAVVALVSLTVNITQAGAIQKQEVVAKDVAKDVRRIDTGQQVVFSRLGNIDKNIEDIRDSMKELAK